jgi:hypothetical protein
MAEPEGSDQEGSISFGLAEEDIESLKRLAGNKSVRLSGRLVGGRLVIDQIGFQSRQAGEEHPFKHVNAPYAHLVPKAA